MFAARVCEFLGSRYCGAFTSSDFIGMRPNQIPFEFGDPLRMTSERIQVS
jgi:hypothetical protein